MSSQSAVSRSADVSRSPDTVEERRMTGRKARALLAGGLVLGVGAAVVLAAWTDDEFVTGLFSAGQFDLQGSTDGVTFDDHASAGDAATLSFSVPVTELAPDDTVYAGFWVRLAEGTTDPASLELVGFTGSGTATAQLDYTIHAIAASATCDATTATGTPIASGSLDDTTATSTGVTLAVPAAAAPGAAEQLCFAVTAAAGLEQGTTATGTWQFTATSS
jgi:predicted ribosomally synthesized peptide with SipW-like signal peptide